MKKRLSKLIATGLLTLTVAAPTFANVDSSPGFLTGNKLIDECTNTRQFADGFCYGYITGIVDAMNMENPTCMKGGSGISVRQVHDVAVQYLQSHPADRNYSADSLVRTAINDAFSCR